MRREAEAAHAAYRLWKSESRAGTVAAAVLVVAFFGWPLFQWWRASSGGNR